MATRQSTVDHILDRARAARDVSARKMFGEFALYRADKLVGLICDDTLFLKPTAAGRKLIGTVEEAPPYPSAKSHFVIDPDRIEDGEWLSNLIQLTADELPTPKPKKSKTKRVSKA